MTNEQLPGSGWWARLLRAVSPDQACCSQPTGADRFPDYITCPYCGEPEIEIWAQHSFIDCHNCGETIEITDR